ncbi:hypothetical protein JW992_14945, partial [candidate division KSB1 bacterium]|nr:hypothetical protein [candidate division KSB1 bacterium]
MQRIETFKDNRWMSKAFRIILIAGVFCATPDIHAQISARSLGMGGGASALARGIHAPMVNPANLGLPDNPRFSLSFFSVGAGAYNN